MLYLINNLFDLKAYNGKHLLREFPSKGWSVGFVYQLLQKLPVTAWVGRPLFQQQHMMQHQQSW